MNAKMIANSCGAAVMFSLAGAAGMAPACAETLFNVTNLVSDGAVPAKLVDPNLINPWGIAMSPASPFWISDNGTGLATLYSVSQNNSLVSQNGLIVTIPPAFGSTSNPTGQVFNGGTGFLVNGKPAKFLFDSEDGAISGWNGGTSATIVISHPSTGTGGSVYKGLALDPTDSFLFATDFRNGDIEEYNSSWTQVNAGLFTDPNLPAGYAPFNLKVINGDLYVTYALQDAAKHDDVAGPGHGFVDVFNLDGTFDKRLISGGALNSPWGLLIAPSSFGSFAGDLLVGNFGDGMIDAYNATTGAFIDVLRGPNDKPIDITDLWALALGNGGSAGSPNSLYFTAGLVDEGDGLFGSLTVVPEPSTWAMTLAGFAGLGLAGYRSRRARIEAA
jgi:uncharacterized protein (TIGR03118 family)